MKAILSHREKAMQLCQVTEEQLSDPIALHVERLPEIREVFSSGDHHTMEEYVQYVARRIKAYTFAERYGMGVQKFKAQLGSYTSAED